MTKPMGIGLQKQVVELVLADGIKNKLAAEVRPDGQLFDIQNAELQYVGKMTRRRGFNVVDSHTIGPEVQTILDGTYQKLFQRDGELCCISDLSVSVGSGIGSRDTGDTIFSYSNVENGWKPHAKVPRSTLTAFQNFSGGEQAGVGDCAVTSDGVAMVAWYGATTNGVKGTFVRVVDLNNNATLLDTTQVGGLFVSGAGDSAKVQCLAIGKRLFVFFMESAGASPQMRYYDTSNRTGAIHPAFPTIGTNVFTFTPTDWSVATDGTFILALGGRSAVPSVLTKWDVNFSGHSDVNAATFAAPGPTNVDIDVAFGLVSMVYTHSATGVWFEQFNTLLARTGSAVTMGFAGAHAQCAVITLSGTRAGVMANLVSLAFHQFDWAPVTITAGSSVVSSSPANVKHVWMGGHPFMQGGHVCVPFFGVDAFSNDTCDFGYVVCEIDFSDASGPVFSREVPLPIASFGNDFANPRFRNSAGTLFDYQAFGRGGVNGNNWYFFARFLTEAIGHVGGLNDFYNVPAVYQLVSLNFTDQKRWSHAPVSKMTLLGSSLPTCYDGRVAHECGFLFRPTFLSATPVVGGGLVNGKTYFFRLVYQWVDSFGNRWFSQPSYASRAGDVNSFTADVTNQSVTLTARPLVLSGKTANSNFEQQDLQVWLFMTRADQPNDYFLHSKAHQSPWDTIPVSFTVTAEPALSAEEMYTGGGELENYAPPPAVCITAHRDRLLAISDFTQSLWYTKPAVAGRGVEWALEQQVPLPERGMAVVSNEAAAIVFTENDIYSLEGYGPSATGQPPDAFGRLIQVSSQMGLYERNAAANTPVGVVFRARQGWYVLRNTMAVEYIGADVEGRMQPLDTVSGMDVDQTRGVLRIAVTQSGGNGYILNYWYDTNRWSRDILGTGGFIQDTLVRGADYFVIHDGNVLKYDVTGANMFDGTQAVATEYNLEVETGWFTFGNLENTKRVWRVYLTFRCNESLPLISGLNVFIYGDWNDTTPISSQVFEPQSPLPGVSTIRVHLPAQKLKAIKVKVAEFSEDPGNNARSGFDFISLGFELGLKRGGPKLPATQSA